MVSHGTACLRASADGVRRKIVRYSRFLGNPKVTTDRIVEGWGATTAVAARGREVLAIQDTCEIHIKTTATRRRGLGEIGKGNNYGILLHAMVAVDADTGLCLGLVDGSIRTRAGRRKTCHGDRVLSDKESRRWIETARGGAAVLSEAARVTVIADAESGFLRRDRPDRARRTAGFEPLRPKPAPRRRWIALRDRGFLAPCRKRKSVLAGSTGTPGAYC